MTHNPSEMFWTQNNVRIFRQQSFQVLHGKKRLHFQRAKGKLSLAWTAKKAGLEESWMREALAMRKLPECRSPVSSAQSGKDKKRVPRNLLQTAVAVPRSLSRLLQAGKSSDLLGERLYDWVPRLESYSIFFFPWNIPLHLHINECASIWAVPNLTLLWKKCPH